jgi:hypothetical protein
VRCGRRSWIQHGLLAKLLAISRGQLRHYARGLLLLPGYGTHRHLGVVRALKARGNFGFQLTGSKHVTASKPGEFAEGDCDVEVGNPNSIVLCLQ